MSLLNCTSREAEMLSSLKKDFPDLTEKEMQKAREGDGDSMLAIADKYSYIQNYPKSIQWKRKAAEQNNSEAQLCLAEMYAQGDGVSKDGQQAMEWYLKAANNGQSVAQFWMGVLCREGDDVPKNIDTAIEWFTKAANQGDWGAQEELGHIYDNKVNDLQKAVNWYKKSLDHGNEDVRDDITRLNKQGYYPVDEKRKYAEEQKQSVKVTKKARISEEKDQNRGLSYPQNSKDENGDSVIKQILKNAGDAFELELKKSKMENEKLQQMLDSSEQQRIEREALLQQEISSLKQDNMEKENKIQKLKEFVGHL